MIPRLSTLFPSQSIDGAIPAPVLILSSSLQSTKLRGVIIQKTILQICTVMMT
jgi:hypothetical protein